MELTVKIIARMFIKQASRSKDEVYKVNLKSYYDAWELHSVDFHAHLLGKRSSTFRYAYTLVIPQVRDEPEALIFLSEISIVPKLDPPTLANPYLSFL